jgi:hypothetical protein
LCITAYSCLNLLEVNSLFLFESFRSQELADFWRMYGILSNLLHRRSSVSLIMFVRIQKMVNYAMVCIEDSAWRAEGLSVGLLRSDFQIFCPGCQAFSLANVHSLLSGDASKNSGIRKALLFHRVAARKQKTQTRSRVIRKQTCLNTSS